MNLKKGLKTIIAIIFIYTILLFGLIGYFKYDPTMFGLMPYKKDSLYIEKQSKKIEPYMILTLRDFDKLQSGVFKNEVLFMEKENLKQAKKKLEDSLLVLLKNQKIFNDTLKKSLDSAFAAKNRNKTLLDSITKINNLLQKIKDELVLKEQLVKDQEKFIEKRIDSLERANFSIFAKIYNNTDPVDIARILENLDERDAAKILKNMQKRKAGKVLESMKPEHAAAILMLGAGE